MKNIVEYIDVFLKRKNVEWIKVTDDAYVGQLSSDSEFCENQIHKLMLKKDKKYSCKCFLVNENLFLVFDALGNKLEKDLSNEWRNYLQPLLTAEDEKLKQEIREYLADKQNDVYNHNSFDDILE